ncbi:hypothetical protein F4810DRAFT_469007 [Camillea tinctor]|nr:hypothetical protein F4810DRAFT_469007 [Camillea tinctor]
MPASDQTPTAVGTLISALPLDNNDTNHDFQESNVTIEFPRAILAEDADFVGALVAIVNAAYLETEAGIFKPGYQRTTADGISSLIRAGHLGVALLETPASSSPNNPPQNGNEEQETETRAQGRTPIGCICIRRDDADGCGELGMLALDATYRGRGLGRDLVVFAEKHCLGLRGLRLELLVPIGWEHPFKVRLLAWYQRMGYVPVEEEEGEKNENATRDFAESYPELAPMLEGPVELRVLEKALA